MKYVTLGSSNADIVVVWAHGWGHTNQNLVNIARPLEALAYHIIIDFPGFGESPVPKDVWSPEDYGHFLAVFLKQFEGKKIVWVGHSFGCRVAVHIGAHYPDLVDEMCLVAAAGLKPRRGIWGQCVFQARVKFYKFLWFMIRFGLSEGWLKSRFGSADYRAAGDMRDILVRTVNEDLTEISKTVRCSVTLVFGLDDRQTPPEMGQRYHDYISHSDLVELEGYDHYSILTDGRHHLSRIVKNMLREKNNEY